jgi:glycosyltransferase involved in cell wall biosynthesis
MTDVIVVATHRAGLGDVQSLIRALSQAGAQVQLACTFDAKGLPDYGHSEARRLRMDLSSRAGSMGIARRIVTGARRRVIRLRLRRAPVDQRVAFAARYDPWFAKAAPAAIAIIAADDAALPAVLGAHGSTQAWLGHHTAADIDDLIRKVAANRVAQAAADIAQLASRRLTATEVPALLAAWETVTDADDNYLAVASRHATAVVSELLRLHEYEAAQTIAAQAATQSLTPAENAQLQLQVIWARISRQEPVKEQELASALRNVLEPADRAVAAGQLDTAETLLTTAVQAAFHRELHADGLSSPLVEDPAGFMMPLRNSTAFHSLCSPTPGGQPQPRPSTSKSEHRVLVIPGAYSNFTKTIIAGLGDRSDVQVRVLDLKPSQPAFRGVTVHPPLLRDRLYQAHGQAVQPPTADERENLAWADTIFIDWCDNNAVWATMHAPKTARIVIRIHSVDALSPHPHLVDWSKVCDVVFVGDHIRAMLTRAVPELAQTARTHVVPNLLHLDHFDRPKNPTAERSLALVGWAQRVKDPLFALDVLARLRSADESWRLLLIGADFAPTLRAGEAAYRQAYRHRALADDVRDAIHYIGFTRRLPEILREAGYVLSTSRREGLPVGVTEAAASSAIPVVRNWPMFAKYEAVASAFPADWIVDTPEQAAKRILAHVDPQERAAAGAAARAFVMKHYNWPAVAPRFFEILLG